MDAARSRSRVTEFVSELEPGGLVTIALRGQGKTNLYTIHFQVKPAVDKRAEYGLVEPFLVNGDRPEFFAPVVPSRRTCIKTENVKY
jgi:hypothetical protein